MTIAIDEQCKITNDSKRCDQCGRLRGLDLFCGAGGCSKGYDTAGFCMSGIDNTPMRRYPYQFFLGNALRVTNFAPYAFIHASPPCKVHTALRGFSHPWHENLIPQTRELLNASGLPYVIENVPGAERNNNMRIDLTLCGSMFGLGVRRHRLFELSGMTIRQLACDHQAQETVGKRYTVKRYNTGVPVTTLSAVIGVYGGGRGSGPGEADMWREAMGISWMIRDELSQAIPPAYTEYIGRQMIEQLS